MNPEFQNVASNLATPPAARLKIIGVGTAAASLLTTLPASEFGGVGFGVVDTTPVAAPETWAQVILETKTLRGFGSGGDPGRARAMAEAKLAEIRALCGSAAVVVVVAGLGGGTGGGVATVVARVAREQGALVLGLVSLPFPCEGSRRQQLAREAVMELQAECDGVLSLPLEKVMPLLPEDLSFRDTFQATTPYVLAGVQGLARLLTPQPLLEIHRDELLAVLRDAGGQCGFATVEARGNNRTETILAQLAAHPLLDAGRALETAGAVLVSLAGGPDLSLRAVDGLVQALTARCGAAQVKVGAVIENDLSERLIVTLVTCPPASSAAAAPPVARLELGADLLGTAPAARPVARSLHPGGLLPPAAAADTSGARPPAKSGRTRKGVGGARMRQTTLPLDIVNKGRFDKSEPTIYKGEDLDLPTYVRRGIAMN